MTRDEAVQLAAAYAAHEDEDPLAAGREIEAGDFSRKNLGRIFRWKTKDRGKSRLCENSDQEIRDALRLAVSAETPRSAIAVLTGLYGVDTPVTSAVMTAIRPGAFTVLDFRALAALGYEGTNRSVPLYLEYLRYCTSLAERWNMPLRQLDRALWTWRA